MLKIFKKLIITAIMLVLGISESIVGEYRVVGFSAINYDFSRQNTPIVVTEKSGFDLTPKIIYTILEGEKLQYDPEEYFNFPLELILSNLVDIYVYFAEDGTATILEPTAVPNEGVGEGCVTGIGVTYITEDFSYTADLNASTYIPVFDIIGLESLSPYKGAQSGSISIVGSSVFDNVPLNPTEVSVPFMIDTSSVFDRSNGFIPANAILPSKTAGYVIKSTDMYSYIPISRLQDLGYDDINLPHRPSLYLEWHAIDGPINESGLGDIIGEDEDGFDGDYDSVFGLEYIKITRLNQSELCGYHSTDAGYYVDIAGDHIESLRTVKYNQCEGTSEACQEEADNWINSCVNFEEPEGLGDNLYLMNIEQDPNFNWGGYVTWNSTLYNIPLISNYLTDEQIANYLIDDSNENFDSTCLDDCPPESSADLQEYITCSQDCSGRIIFEYTPQCIPSFNVRYFMAELKEDCQPDDKDDCGVCFGNGIPDGYCDCYWAYREDCNGICDDDPSNDDLSCFGCDGVANSGLEYDECGHCGGSGILDECDICNGDGKSAYCYDFDGDGIGNQSISEQYCPNEVPNSWGLDCSSLDNADITPNKIAILKTYPNPFNPNINIEFELYELSNIEIKIYDVKGRLVENLLNNNYSHGTHAINWNAESFSSGIYFIEFKSNEHIITNRVELLK